MIDDDPLTIENFMSWARLRPPHSYSKTNTQMTWAEFSLPL